MKFKKLVTFLNLIGVTAVAAPLLLTSCSTKQFITNDIYDPPSNESNNNTQNGTGGEVLLPTKKEITFAKYTVLPKITFQDYEKSLIDANGAYVFIQNRGKIVEKTVDANVPMSIDSFLKNWNFLKFYLANNNNTTPSKIQNLSAPVQEGFLDDISYLLFREWNTNKRIFNVGKDIKKNIVLKTNTDNYSINFDISINIQLIDSISTPITINLFNKSVKLQPKTKYTLKLTTDNKDNLVLDQVSYFNDRYFQSWKTNDVKLIVTDTSKGNYDVLNTTLNEFYSAKDTHSNAYNLEFQNLTYKNSKIDYKTKSIQEYLSGLTDNKIKEKIETETNNKIKLGIATINNIGLILQSLANDATIGDLLDVISTPLKEMMDSLNVLSPSVTKLIDDVFKSFKTGKPILSLLADNKDAITYIISNLLKDSLGNISELLSFALETIKPDMSESEKNKILSLLPDGNPLKDLLTMLLNNPFSLDLLDKALSLYQNEIAKILDPNTTNPQLEQLALIKLLRSILNRNKTNEITNKPVIYQNKILEALLKDQTSKQLVFDAIKMVLNLFKINLSNPIITSVVDQIFVKNNSLNPANAMAFFAELSKFLLSVSNKNNFEISSKFNKNLSLKNYISDKPFREYDFEYETIFAFKSEQELNVENLLKCLPEEMKINVTSGVNVTVKKEIFKIFPRKITFIAGDKFKFIFRPVQNKLLYEQYQENESTFNSYTSIIELEFFIEQKSSSEGVLSNWLNNFHSKEDWIGGLLNSPKAKNDENFNFAKNYIQNFLLNHNKITFYLNGKDKTFVAEQKQYNTGFDSGYTFKWNDVDANNDFFALDFAKKPSFDKIFTKSQQYWTINNMFTAKDVINGQNINYKRIIDKNGNTDTKDVSMSPKEIDFVKTDNIDNQQKLKDTLFQTGNQIDKQDIVSNITPLFKTDVFTKTIATVLVLPVKLRMQFLAFKVDLMLPYQVADLSSITRTGDNNYSLTNLNYSNKFSKLFFFPKIVIGT